MPDRKRLSQSVPKHNGPPQIPHLMKGESSLKDGFPEKADVMYMSPRPLISQQRQRRYFCTPLFSSLSESQFKTSNERTIEKEMKRHWHRNGKN